MSAIMNPKGPCSSRTGIADIATDITEEGVREITERGIDRYQTGTAYEGYAQILGGRGTICIPLATAAEVPSPQESYVGVNSELIPPEEIQALWNKVVQDSTNQVSRQVVEGARQQSREKSKKLEALLEAALNSGNMDLAMMLMSGLVTQEANDAAAGLMQRMQNLQQEKRGYADQIARLGTSAEDSKKTNDLNLKIGNIGTEIQFLQTFLQDVMSQKNETQQMASNYLKSRHDTAMGIIRNMA